MVGLMVFVSFVFAHENIWFTSSILKVYKIGVVEIEERVNGRMGIAMEKVLTISSE